MADLVGERYEPLAVVARGDEAEILRARDHLGGRQVALQVRHLVSPFEMGALVTEALVLLDIERHPHLPLVREHFLLDDSYFLVMDWIEGVGLHRVLRTEGAPGLPLDRVVELLVPVAGALEHLHAQKAPVVHQNVRPANLIRTGDGRIALVGFGLSAGWGLPRPLMSEPPTPASDIFGLAVTAHTLLTGAPPGPGTVARFSGLSDAEAEGVVRALRRGLDPDPARRPHSPSALLEELRAGASTLMLPPVDVPAADLGVAPSVAVWADFDVEPEADVETDVAALDRPAGVEVDEQAEIEAAMWAALWAGLDVVTEAEPDADPGIEVVAWSTLWDELDLVPEPELDAGEQEDLADFEEFEADFDFDAEFEAEVEAEIEAEAEAEVEALPEAGD
ncbi:MAG: serine/threonine protein kinase, partial [Acidimicrobiia bacterium]